MCVIWLDRQDCPRSGVQLSVDNIQFNTEPSRLESALMLEPNWLNEREQRAWRGWVDASRRVLAASDRQLKTDSGLTTDDYEVLVRLSEADDRRMRMSDLAESVTNSPSRLSQRIDRLSRDGVVERGRCDVDARVLWVVLTDAGFQRLREAASGHVEEVRRLFIDRLSADEIELLATLLPRLADSLAADD